MSPTASPWSRLRLLLVLASIALAPLAPAQDGPPTPKGWTRSVERTAERVTYRPKGLAQGAELALTLHKRELVEGAWLETWLTGTLAALAPPSGTWTAEAKVEPQTANLATASRAYRTAEGAQGFLVASAVCVDGLMVRLATLAFVPREGDDLSAHTPTAQQLLAALLEHEKSTAVAEGRGLQLEAPPPAVPGLRAGGTLRPGRYVGNLVTSNDNEVLRKVDVLLFAEGEYQFIVGDGEAGESGTFRYSPATGRLQIDDPLWNSSYNPADDFCVYGKDDKGRELIVAEEDRGTSVFRTRLRRVGDVDRLAPSAVALRKAAQEEEANRYKWVTPPGQGVRPAEFEAIVIVTRSIMNGLSTHMEDEAYLLMSDGRVMDGLPVSPDELDVAASRAREPDRWGRWRKSDAGAYEFAWPVRPDEFATPTGFVTIARPVPKGTRLAGKFEAASSWGMVGGAGGANFWGVTLTSEGRFETFRHGIMGNGGGIGNDGMPVHVGSVYDDEGATTSVSGPGIGGGVTSRTKGDGSHRRGSYEFDRYTLVLRYDNGRVRRLPTCFDGEGDRGLWFDGEVLRKDGDGAK